MTTGESITSLVAAVHDYLKHLDDNRLDPYLADWPSTNSAFRSISPHSLPVLACLQAAVKTTPEKTGTIVNMLVAISDQIAWGQTYSVEDFNAGFLEKYGWTEFIGLRGPIPSERLACGVLMLGPGVEYPRHRHEAEEVYVPLTGQTHWLQGNQEWAFKELGQPIYHAPWITHAMKTGPSPLLALYLWRAGNLTQKSIIDS